MLNADFHLCMLNVNMFLYVSKFKGLKQYKIKKHMSIYTQGDTDGKAGGLECNHHLQFPECCCCSLWALLARMRPAGARGAGIPPGQWSRQGGQSGSLQKCKTHRGAHQAP